MGMKTLKDLISEEIESEEGLIEIRDRITIQQLWQIRDEILIYLELNEGYQIHQDTQMDEDEFNRDDDCIKSQTITIYYFLRTLIKTGRILISPIR
jgi:hypothetical protein